MFSIIKTWVAFGHTTDLSDKEEKGAQHCAPKHNTPSLKKAKLHSETSIPLQCTDIFFSRYWLSKKVDTLVYLWGRWSSPSHVLTLYRFHKFPNLYCWLEHFIMCIHLYNASQVTYHLSSILISLVHSADITCRFKAKTDTSIWYQSVCILRLQTI